MKTYADRLKEHLGIYRTSGLGVPENQKGVWSRNGREYDHILPASLLQLNILETIRREFWEFVPTQRIKLHKDFAHLNSSQALTFNLFFPFFGMSKTHPDARPERLLEALGLLRMEVKDWGFERILNPLEETNFDFYVEFMEGQRAVIEVKLTEREFGVSVANPERLRKLKEIYLPNLQGKVRCELLEEEAFFARYQLLRNVSYADAVNGDCAIFLLPRANVALAKAAEEFFAQDLLPSIRPYVAIYYLEDVLQTLGEMDLPPWLETHRRLLVEKYVI
jgi:hypothetical protein